MDNLLKPIVTGWLRKVKAALDVRRKVFDTEADEMMRFYTGPYAAWMYGKKATPHNPDDDFSLDEAHDGIPAPSFRMSVNKAAEVVQLFGPVLYQRNPDRKVSPRHVWAPPPELFGDVQMNPMAGQQAMGFQQIVQQNRAQDAARGSLLEMLLNFLPKETGLRDDSRAAIDQALITGLGVWWTEAKTLPTGGRVVGSFYDTYKSFVADPDARRWPEVKWIARMCVHPIWEVEREYQLPEGSIKANAGETLTRLAATLGNFDEDYLRSQGRTNDLLVYWKIYSKMGLGGRLHGVMPQMPEYTQELDGQFGDYCFLVVAEGVDYPLNMPPEVQAGEDAALAQRAQWPIPYWLDDEWPVTDLAFHRVPDQFWPMSHLKPGLGELRFINWAYSMLAAKIRVASRDFIVLLKSSAEEIKEAIKHGPDLSVIEIDSIGKNINEMVQFLQHPAFNPEIYKIIDRVMDLFDKRVGLTDLIYGETDQQMRSAEEAQVKQSATSVRPEDMAQQVEDAGSKLAQKELTAARWLLEAEDVRPILGDVGAFFWQELVQTQDPRAIFQTYEVAVEQGSTRRPDKKRDQQNLQAAMTNLFAPFMQYFMASGNPQPVNALIAAWAKTMDLDATKFMLMPPAPPMMPGAPPGPGGGPAPAPGPGPAAPAGPPKK